ncbi:MAG: hypothetical protein H6822_31205 [Planctomycetaceae bacterium]|nr:hypothetical protein [Planctomycetales bacterium]MCB9926649.1 hypothetical protein [Planctomycetaceae bacterium]
MTISLNEQASRGDSCAGPSFFSLRWRFRHLLLILLVIDQTHTTNRRNYVAFQFDPKTLQSLGQLLVLGNWQSKFIARIETERAIVKSSIASEQSLDRFRRRTTFDFVRRYM